jgi:N-acetylglutamate synthase-like GNAT family acetyltransferase
VEAARQQGFRGVFALSLDERMWDFFRELGFREVPRETLPGAWAAQYDMRRPSRAFAKTMDPPTANDISVDTA